MEIVTIFLRTIIIYFVVFLVLRIMGKREIGKLSVFDLVISIMIAEIAVFVLEDANKPMSEGLVPIFTLVLIQIMIAYISLKNDTIRKWFEGKPSLLIRNGKLDRDEMKRQRYNLDDLMLQLRSNQITNIEDVEFAFLETNGQLTVIEKKRQESGDASEAGKNNRHPLPGIRFEILPVPLIMDGKVNDDNLAKIGKTRFWLKNQIQEKGASDFKEVFFCTIDHRGNLYVDKKEK